ncbi:MAG: hypothetical protein WC788_05320 [Candidatus Paceibacterota bacterium]|jgi:hypothetical protein
MIVETVNYVIDNIWDIIGTAALLWAASSLHFAKRKWQKKISAMKSLENGLSKRPVAICIGVGKSPCASVKAFLQEKKWDIPILSWATEGFLKPEDYPGAMAKINSLRKQALDLGVSEALLFYAGPVDLAMFIGASFDNWVPVKVYAFANGTYELHLVLEREAARSSSLRDDLAKEIAGGG